MSIRQSRCAVPAGSLWPRDPCDPGNAKRCRVQRSRSCWRLSRRRCSTEAAHGLYDLEKIVGRLPGFPRHVPATGSIGGRSRKCFVPWPCRYTGQGPPPVGMPLRLPPRSPRTGPRCCRASRRTCRSVEPEPPWTARKRRNSRRGRRYAPTHWATGCRPRAGCPRCCPEVRQPARPVPVPREQDVGAPAPSPTLPVHPRSDRQPLPPPPRPPSRFRLPRRPRPSLHCLGRGRRCTAGRMSPRFLDIRGRTALSRTANFNNLTVFSRSNRAIARLTMEGIGARRSLSMASDPPNKFNNQMMLNCIF